MALPPAQGSDHRTHLPTQGGPGGGRRETEDSRKGSREGIEGMGCGESAIKVKKRKGKKDGREKMKIEK
jgi:hypothetical protein